MKRNTLTIIILTLLIAFFTCISIVMYNNSIFNDDTLTREQIEQKIINIY